MTRITTPVTVVTGFLGAGKTTLVNRILGESSGQRIAVIENEFGAVGVDAEFLVAENSETVIQLANGCVCCTVRGDMARALHQLAQMSDAGAFEFDRVLIETTGIADPGPIVQTFLAETAIRSRFHIDGVVTVVDAFHGAAQLELIENRAQIAYADRILLSKSDLAGTAARDALCERLARINPRAESVPVDLRGDDLRALLATLFDLRAYTLDYVPPAELAGLRAHLGASSAGESPRLRPVVRATHTDDVGSYAFETDQPIDLARLNDFLDRALERFGPRLWRCKGIVHAEHERKRLVVQGVQSLVQINGGPVWRAFEARATVLVFIGQSLDFDWIAAELDACVAARDLTSTRAGKTTA